MSLSEFFILLLGVVLLGLVLVFVIYSTENMRRFRYSAALMVTAVGAICFLLSMVSTALAIFFVAEVTAHTAAIFWVFGSALVLTGQFWRVAVFRRIYGSVRAVINLSSSKWSLAGTIALILGIPVYFIFFYQSIAEGFSWYSVGSEALWVFVFACLIIAERKLFQVSSAPHPILRETTIQNEAQTLVAYSNLTNRFLAHLIPVIGVSGVEDALTSCVEEHPILFGDKIIEGGLLNVDQLIKNSRRIHESERPRELLSAFSDLNTTIIDLYAALTSPVQAYHMVGTEAEIYRDDAALWNAGVPLGKYSEAVYERELMLGLPEGIADAGKVNNFAYILFKRYLEQLLSKCKKSTRIDLKRKLDELAKKNQMVGLVDISDEGKIDLGNLYQHLSKLKFKEGMREIVKTFSDVFNACYEAAKKDLGLKKASETATEILSELLRRYGGFLQHYGIIEAIPEGVQIPGTYLPLVTGKCYLVEGRSPRHAFKMFADLVRFGNPGLIITTSHPTHIRKEYNLPERITILWLSKVEVEYAISPSNLGIIRDRISAFVTKKENAVVMLEGLEYLITTNGFDLTLKLMHDIREITMVNRARLIVPVAPLTLEPKQLEMLRRFMEVIAVEGKA
ncbi:MAG: DUF835 domain-containing protein [Candidatus Hadarchaeum sp.]|uniref:DUF835 domain-containing protein n=1 Tax=Candidatus Hadarchaeum sp. TaxID=2883567 RepID=UPI003D0B4BBF